MASKFARMRKELQCSVCYELLNKPKLLRCSHRLCRQCLHDLIMSKNTRRAHIVQCPYCKEEENITDMVDGKPREEWVDIFKDDHLVAAIIGNLQSIDTCEKHGEEPFWIYCIQCEVPLCHVCYRVEHKDHQTGSLEVKAEERRSFYKGLLDSCCRKIDNIEKGTSHSPNVKVLLTHYQNALKSLEQEYKQAQDLLKEMENQSKIEMQRRLKNEFIHCCSSEKEQNQTLVAKLKEIRSNTSDAAVLAKNHLDEIKELNLPPPLRSQALAGFVIQPVDLPSVRKLLAKITPGITKLEEDFLGNLISTAPTQKDMKMPAPKKGQKRKRASKFDHASPTPSTSSGSPCQGSSGNLSNNSCSPNTNRGSPLSLSDNESD